MLEFTTQKKTISKKKGMVTFIIGSVIILV